MNFEKAENSSFEYFHKFNSVLFNTPHVSNSYFCMLASIPLRLRYMMKMLISSFFKLC